jgi:RND family efflux transporter MFP subunit
MLLASLCLPVSAADALRVAPVSYSPAAGEYVADATVQAVRQSVVSSQVQGRVLLLAVRAGDAVKAGQLIARLDDREYGAAEAASLAAIREAQANLAKAELDHRRNLALARQNFVSAALVDQSAAQLKAQQARVEALRAGAAVTGATRSHALISAPYAGIVAATHVEAGDMAMPGNPVVSLFQPGALRAVAYLPEAQTTALRAALARTQPVIEIGGLRVPGVRTTILPAADPSTRTTEVRIDLPATVKAAPGQFVRAHFALGEAARLAIPAQAVLRRGELSAVYVRTAAGRFQQRQIRIGERLLDERIEVLAGLRAGELVALDPVKAGIAAVSGAQR